MCKKHCVCSFLITNKMFTVSVSLPTRSAFFSPSKEEDKSKDRPIDMLLQIIYFLHLYTTGSQIFEQQCKQT